GIPHSDDSVRNDGGLRLWMRWNRSGAVIPPLRPGTNRWDSGRNDKSWMVGAASGAQSAVLAAVVEQRPALDQIHALDFAQENRVVSRGIFCNDIAGEIRQSVLKDGDARFGPTIADTKSRVGLRSLVARRKMLGERLLGIVQNAHAEAPLGPEKREQAALLVHTNGDQLGLEGNGRKRIGGHAMDLAGLAFDSDHGDPGRKTPHDAAKEFGCNRSGGHS